MDPIKEAFSKIKEDIYLLKDELSELRHQISQIKESLTNQTTPTHNPTQDSQQTDRQTHNQTTPTHNLPLEELYSQNNDISTGNRGVPTDRQTDQQTDQQTHNGSHNPQNLPQIPKQDPISEFKRANEILSSLDDIKRDIRAKFKNLTPQEMLVFSTLYSLEEQNCEEITYKLLADNLNLSESSIRDYINKLTKKGVPVDKIRQNNKTILLKVSQDLKSLTNLTTIQHLREL